MLLSICNNRGSINSLLGKIATPYPDWLVVPTSHVGVVMEFVKSMWSVKQLLGKSISDSAVNLTGAFIWLRCKAIYRFDNVLAETLATQSLDAKIPTEIFNYLPYPCVYIEREMQLLKSTLNGFFAWLDWDESKGNQKLLRILFLTKNGDTQAFLIPLSGDSIMGWVMNLMKHDDILQHANDELSDLRNAAIETGIPQLLSECINLLLYLCSEKPDISDEALLLNKNNRKVDAQGNAKRVVIWDVGTRIGAALRKAENSINTTVLQDGDNRNVTEDAESLVLNESHNQMRPHMRRAHWHSYWTGKRGSPERKLILKWLPPIPIKIADDEIPAVITPVKK